MARRIGFSTPDDEPRRKTKKRSTADTYLDEFRAKAADKRQLSERLIDPKDAPVRTKNWPVILFLMVWLTLWTGGILMVTSIILSGEGEAFLYFWLLGAVIGWFVAVFVLIQNLRGKPIKPKAPPK